MDGADPVAAWRNTLHRCCAILSSLAGVRGLIVVGSGASGAALDCWSDLDLVVLLADGNTGQFFPALEWLSAFGDVYALDTSSGPDHNTVRACFTDLARVDFILVSESRLGDFSAAPGPLQGGVRVVLDRTGGALAEALRRVPTASAADSEGSAEDAFRQLERQFRWNGVLAATKLGRGDLLIGGHLALEMVQACLVLGMLIRDRAAGTRHHRRGDGIAPGISLPPALSAEGVGDLIAGAAEYWRALAAEWDPAYVFPTAPLLALLGRGV